MFKHHRGGFDSDGGIPLSGWQHRHRVQKLKMDTQWQLFYNTAKVLFKIFGERFADTILLGDTYD